MRHTMTLAEFKADPRQAVALAVRDGELEVVDDQQRTVIRFSTQTTTLDETNSRVVPDSRQDGNED